jgi:hypothetical protein
MNATEENEMPKARTNDVGEAEVDYMADAPPSRPYSEAVTDEQRALMVEYGLMEEKPTE